MDVSQISGTIQFIGAFIEIVLAFLYWFRGKSKANFHLGLAALFSAVFIFNSGLVFFLEHNKLFWMRNSWLGVLITPAFLTFIYYFTGKTKHIKLKSFLWYFIGIIIVYFALTTSYFTTGVSPVFPFRDIHGPLDPLGRIYIFAGAIIAFFYFLREYFKSQGFRKWQMKYFILGISIRVIGGIVDSVIFPLFYPQTSLRALVGVCATILGALCVAYAIFKRELFGIRIILTEILVGAIAIILLAQAFLSETSSSKILGFSIFFPFLLVGYLLIRVTKKEIERKEEAERLAQQLKELNETLESRIKERTQELEQSFQEIKKRKNELERFYNLTVGRELKMVELKKQIQELKKKLGEKLITK